MQRLRILVPLLLLGLVAVVATDVQAQAAKPATRPATAKPAAAKPKPQPKKMNVGEVLTWKTPLAQVKPVGKPVDLAKREGRPLALLFWSTGATVAREELQALDAFVKKKKLARDMDVYAIGGFNPERQDAADLADMATILGVDTIPILVDPEFKLAKKIGATQFPDIVLFDKDGKLIVKGLRGLDHGRLRGSAGNCETLLKHVALNGTAEPVKRTSRFYPAERLKGRKIPDFELPYYHPDGYGKGKSAKLSDLMTGQRPAAIFIFSSTCKH
ncbi:MAG: TlpA disulfide reductase family protein, partial [Acidobacteriota bacterium]